MINVGDRVKDKITGFTGICVSKTEYLQGCTRISIQPEQLHDGKPIDVHWFDEPQVALLQAGVIESRPLQYLPGGPTGSTPAAKPPQNMGR